MKTRIRKLAINLPADVKILCELRGYKTAGLLHIIHDVGLIHHVPLAERDQLFELIREQLPSDVYPRVIY